MRRKSVLKYVWLVFSLIILALPIFVTSTAALDIINICVVIAAVMSYPLNLLPGWILFVVIEWFDSNWFDFSIGTLYPLLFIFCVTGYLQWFVLVPRLAKFIRQTFFRTDVQINLSAAMTNVKLLSEANQDFSFHDWQTKWYDKQKHTPVERVFRNDED